MPLPFMTCVSHRRPWQLAVGVGRKARKLGNVLAFHVIADGQDERLRFTWAIPWLFTLIAEVPFPLNRLSVWITGRIGDRAEYGFWHDYHETKFQWRRVINLDLGEGGHERRWLHRPGQQVSYRHEQYVSTLVADQGNRWAQRHGIDRWVLILSSWRVRSHHWWVPDLYDYRFTLRIESPECGMEEASIKAMVTPQLCLHDVFNELATTLRP